jgi:hypothetical protein
MRNFRRIFLKNTIDIIDIINYVYRNYVFLEEIMIRRKLSNKLIQKEKYQLWNSFIDLLSMESENNLTDIQKNAQRAFWYESEVQNGGHLQYFENVKFDDYSTIVQSIKEIGATEHANILEKALIIYFSKERQQIEDIENYIDEELEGEYINLDMEYGSIEPNMNYYLEKYLEKYKNEFIEIIE